MNILPLGRKEAGYTAKIRAELETKGLLIGPYDVLIAATAISNNEIQHIILMNFNVLTALGLKIGTEPHRGSVGLLQGDAFESEVKFQGLTLPLQSTLIGVHLRNFSGRS